MGEDKKIQKKIQKKIENEVSFIKEYIDSINELTAILESETDLKKIEKINKKIKSKKDMIMYWIEGLCKLEVNVEGIVNNFEEEYKEVMRELYPHGFGNESLKYQRKRESKIASLKKDIANIKKLREELEPYDALDMEHRMKNKLFRKESWFGRGLKIECDENKEEWYNKAWNYLRDIDHSPEFSDEEIQILKDCYKACMDHDEWDKEHNPLVKLGQNITEFGEKVGEHADRTQAQEWAKNLYTDLFPDIVKEAFPNENFDSKELEIQSKEMTKRYIKWCLDPVEIQKTINEKALLEVENKALLDELKESSDFSDIRVKGLVANLVMSKLGKMLNEIADSKEEILFALMKDKIGIEKTCFLMIYETNEKSKEAAELFSKYSFEELGLE